MMSSCMQELYEPNNSFDDSTSSALTNLISVDEELMLCGEDVDYYTLSVCFGDSHGDGHFDSATVDIDIELSFEGAAIPEAESAGVTGVEEVSFTNLAMTEQDIYLLVYPYRPVSEASYRLEITSECP